MLTLPAPAAVLSPARANIHRVARPVDIKACAMADTTSAHADTSMRKVDNAPSIERLRAWKCDYQPSVDLLVAAMREDFATYGADVVAARFAEGAYSL